MQIEITSILNYASAFVKRPLPIQYKLIAVEGEYLFFDAMHGSTVTGASNAEPYLRMDSGIAAIGRLGIAD